MNRVIGLALVPLIVLPCLAQEVLLRHRLAPGRSAKAMTEVQMDGDSFLGTEKAATQLHMQMQREFRVASVDGMGNARMDVTVERIRTQGKMDNTSVNEDLAGDKLHDLMFGADRMGIEVSSLGHVRGSSEIPLEQLGISLPSSLGETGGFEFPTFPFEPVRVGDVWTEDGRLLRTSQDRRRDLAGEVVYRLRRIYPTPHGRVAVIAYREATDLSGLGLGAAQPGQRVRASGTAVQVGGLVIKLAGEIEFNIDQGVVLQTAQQGFWNLSMSTPTSTGPQKRGLTQEMEIRIHTRFQWSELQQPRPPFPETEPSEKVLRVPEPEIEDLR